MFFCLKANLFLKDCHFRIRKNRDFWSRAMFSNQMGRFRDPYLIYSRVFFSPTKSVELMLRVIVIKDASPRQIIG